MDGQETLLDLLSRTALSDRRAFHELYEATSARLYGTLLRILRNEAHAQDALQDAYVQIWRRAGDYRPDKGTPLGWMTAIARYRALDQMRRRKHEEISEDTDNPDHVEIDDTDMADYLGMLADGDLAWKCLQEIPEESRNCIVMSYVEGYTHSELSEKLDTPVGTIKSWIRRGIVRLQKCMDEHE